MFNRSGNERKKENKRAAHYVIAPPPNSFTTLSIKRKHI